MRRIDIYLNEFVDCFFDKALCDFVEEYKICECAQDCDKCVFEIKKWLNEEVNDHIILSKQEKAILEYVDHNLRWIARDKNNALFLYEEKPYKIGSKWVCDKNYREFDMYNQLFKFIEWDNEEPMMIGEILKSCEKIGE